MPANRRSDSSFPEVPMWRRPVMTILMLIIAVILTLPLRAQQKAVAPGFSPAKPFTEEQVSNMVRDGLGDESGAKLIEQRGIDFAAAEDFLQNLKAAGASEAFLNALRAAKPPAPARAKKPLNQVQVFALLVGQVPSHRVTMLVEERGIDFEPTDDYLQQIRIIDGDDELIRALKNAKVIKPPSVELELQAQYIRDEMWDEALASLKEAVSKQQFDPVLRVALGEALFRTGDYEQAIRELETAKKLDANLWQATQRMADAHLKIWELKKSLPDRVLACELYQELVSSPSPNDPNSERLAALFPNWNDGTSEKSEAQSRLAKLESPVGTWETDQGGIYFFHASPTEWSLESDRRTTGEHWVGVTGTTPLTEMPLSGLGRHRLGNCIYVGSAEIAVSGHGTKLDVTGTARTGVPLEGGRVGLQVCAESTTIYGNFEFHFVRKE